MGRKNKKTLGIHLGLFLAETICVSGFTIEYLRVRSGNTLSWAYVFEWPLFAGYAVYMWHKLLREENEGPRPTGNFTAEGSDEALKSYNEYLKSVHDSTLDVHSRIPDRRDGANFSKIPKRF